MKTENISELYQDKKTNKTRTIQGLFTFVFLTLYFLSQLSGIYLNDVRANIKIKKKRKIKLLTPWTCWTVELQRWRKGKEERGGRGRRLAGKGRGVGGGGRRTKVGGV